MLDSHIGDLFIKAETPNLDPEGARRAVLELRQLIRWGQISKGWLKLFSEHLTDFDARNDAIYKLNQHKH